MTNARRALFVLCAIAFVAPLWVTPYPPFVDLPQHAAQLALFARIHEPEIAKTYVLDWRTPYLLVYLLARPFVALGPLVALKIVLSAYVVAVPLALARLTDALTLDRRWALFGFPLAYGFSLQWGFLNCALALVPALFVLAAVLRGNRVALVLLSLVLLETHALVFVFTMLCAFVMAPRRRTLWPLVPACLLAIPWTLRAAHDAQTHLPLTWGVNLPRLEWAAGFQLGQPFDVVALIGGVTVLALPLALLARRPLRAWLPFLLTLGSVLVLVPHLVFGTVYVYERLAVFLLPTLLLALHERESAIRGRLQDTLVIVVCLAWAAVLNVRFAAFGREAHAWQLLEAEMQPGRAVRGLVFARSSDFLPAAPVYEHFPAYYQVDHGGQLGFSFAGNFFLFVRYRDPASDRVSQTLEQHPEAFDWRAEPDYDYYVVRAPVDVGPRLFAGAENAIRPVAQVGPWWLYQRVAPLPR